MGDNRVALTKRMPEMTQFFDRFNIAFNNNSLVVNDEYIKHSNEVCAHLQRELNDRGIENADVLVLSVVCVTMLKYDDVVPLLRKHKILEYAPKKLFCNCLQHCFEFLE